jgi:hypothetical protein
MTKKPTRLTASEHRRAAQQQTDWSPQGVGLSPELYAAALRYLFDRPVPQGQEQEWFWNIDEPEFEATPLEWTRIQTVLFANAGHHLAGFGDEQVGMGLNYVMSNMVSNVPFAAADATVPIDEAMRMMRAMPSLWCDCIGPRLAPVRQPIGMSGGRLAYVCYMWFDVWPTARIAEEQTPWRQALWQVFDAMLHTPCREVQIAALHGIGHNFDSQDWRGDIERAFDAFVRNIDADDAELSNYAQAARSGCVQ